MTRSHLNPALVAALVVALLLVSATALAQGETDASPTGEFILRGAATGLYPVIRTPIYHRLTPLERRLVDEALEEFDLEVVDFPEGRSIGETHIRAFDVFQEDDLFPLFLNIFHFTTREGVIERRMTVGKGDTYEEVLVEESRRWVLDPSVFSTAVIVPVHGDDPDTVDLLVVTKDIWSLRMNTNFQITGTNLDFLTVSLSENNFLGYAKQVAISFLLEPDVWSIGPTYVDKAFFGTRMVAESAIKFVFNREDTAFEGAFGTVGLAMPLYSREREWGWSVIASFNHTIHRELQGGSVFRFPFDAEEGEATIPWAWQERYLDVVGSVTRSIGRDLKNDISWGWRFLYRSPQILEEETLDPAVVARFREQGLPRQRRDSYPFVGWRGWAPNFRSFENVETMGFTEDFQLGHDFGLTVGVGNPATGSSVAFVNAGVEFDYTWSPTLEDILKAEVGVGARLEEGEWIDHVITGELRYVTPILWFARIIINAEVEHHRLDPDNSVVTLGGENGLRAYPSAQFRGDNYARVNVEMRSLGIELWTTSLGFVLFWDGGTVWDNEEFDQMVLRQGVGLGFRFVIPQVQRVAIRGDWAFPIDPDFPFFPGLPSFGFEQAF